MQHTLRRRPRGARTSVAVGYVRRSTDRQEQSIPDQKKAIERYAAENGLELARFFVDDAISGTSAVRRPAFQEMVKAAQEERRPFPHVIVYDVKRFGRLDNDEAGYYRHILKVHGVEVLYCGENFSGDATDDLLRPVKQWQAREESKDLSKVTIRGLLSRVEGGYWNGGAPPYGYDLRYESPREGGTEFLFVLRFEADGSKLVLDAEGLTTRTLAKGERVQVSKRDRSRLVPSSQKRVGVVKRIFEMSAEDGMGLRAIANLLNVEGVSSPRGPGWSRIYSGSWTGSTVRSILTNPLYVGTMVWNRRTDARFFRIANGRATERRESYGARLVPNAEDDWIRIPDAHARLVSPRLFQAAQQARGTRGGSEAQRSGKAEGPGAWNGRRSRFLLSGLLVCARCGGRYQGCRRTKAKKRSDGSPVRTYYYGCSGYIRKGRSACRFGAVGQESLEQSVVAAVLAYYEQYRGDEGRRRISELVLERVGVESADLVGARKRAEERVQEIEDGVTRLLDALTEGTRPFIEERLQKLDQERARLVSRLRGIEELELSRADRLALVDECHGFVADLPAALSASSPEVRVRALRRCVDQVVVDREAGRFTMRLRPLPVGSQRMEGMETIESDLESLTSGASPRDASTTR